VFRVEVGTDVTVEDVMESHGAVLLSLLICEAVGGVGNGANQQREPLFPR
jgi:hypothetical protein